MNNLVISLLMGLLLGVFMMPRSVHAQDKPTAPTKSQEQEMNQRNSLPKNIETEIIVCDEEGRKRAEMLIEVYKALASNPTIEEVRKYVRDDYVQHSPTLPDGPQGLAMFFHSICVQYPFAIDVHKVMVIGDWAMAHVNFRNLDTTDPNDLGMSAVDIYTFGPDGKLAEHWDAVQGVPAYSVNPNGMFLQIREK